MALTPIVELGVSEAYEILTERFGVTDLPPLESIENEDWGRDYLLSRFLQFPRVPAHLLFEPLALSDVGEHPQHPRRLSLVVRQSADVREGANAVAGTGQEILLVVRGILR